MLDPKPMCRARLLRWGTRGLVLVLVGAGTWWLGNILVGSNLHTVIPGRVYRSAQPTEASLERCVRNYGIRTVVNLRGCGNPLPWYLAEGRTAQRLGLGLEDVSFSAIHLPAPGELRELLDVLDHAEYPLLLHCRHGSDRTGLAAAVVLLLQDGVPYARARRELGLYYGHLSFGRTGLLDSFFEMYEEWLRATGKDHTPAVFRHWVLDEYRGGWCEGGVENVAATGAPKAGQPIAYRVRLRNRSQATWQLTPITTAGIHVYYHVWDADGAVVADARAGFVEASIPPGARYEVTIVVPPLKAGHYWLAVDLIEEYHCCFYQVGAEVWEEELIVP
jgi:protein tyrosine/serine phosphatase